MTDLPDFKIKALVSFPSNALGGTGIDITKSDGHFIIDLDYSEIGVYQRISLADLKITLGIP